jgi:2-polyprenyl-3-methyl-5-hydroxy-6-metoxy-1,4-benzoquinol methylase
MKVRDDMIREDVLRLVASTRWYHSYEVYPGVVTPGVLDVDPDTTLNSLGFPKDVAGKNILEIGAFDGPFTFELERRGAIVTAMDIQDKEKTGFAVAHRIKRSQTKYIQCDVTNLNPSEHGKYDIVVFMGVYYHILHPLLAFQNIYDVLNESGIMFYAGHILEYSYKIDSEMAKYEKELKSLVDKIPITLFVPELFGKRWSNWYIPNLLCLRAWLATAGFKILEERVHEENSGMSGLAMKRNGFCLAPRSNEYHWQGIASHKDELSSFGRILFFGAGGRFLSLLDEINATIPHERILGIVDNDPVKRGTQFAGFPVHAFDEIPQLKPDLMIATTAFYPLVVEELDEMKIVKNLSFEIRYVDCRGSALPMTESGHEVF